jgi:hypothetical protein
MRRGLGIAVAAASLVLGVSNAALAQGRVGFKAPLASEGVAELVTPECDLSKGTLSCAVYGVTPGAAAKCSAGGAVTELRLGAAGGARRGVLCVDEGFHDWGVLSEGQVWRKSGFDCSHRSSGSGLGRVGRLVCANAGGYQFSVDGLGRISTPPGPQRAWLALGDSYASGEGIPGTDEGPNAQGRECSRANGRDTDAKAWAVSAYEDLKERFGFDRIAFVACTGAITDQIEAQIAEAASLSNAGTWDVVTLGIGGNNIRFADVLFGCLDIPNHWDEFDLTPGCDASPARLMTRIDMLTGKKKPLVKGEYDGGVTLPQVLDRVAEVVHPGGDVVVTGYPQLVEEANRWDRWRQTVIGNCEGIRSYDVGGLRGVTGYLNQQIAIAVHQADARHRAKGVRFHWVDIANDPYEYSDDPGARHALCSRMPWLNGQTLSLRSGDLRFERSFHPMQVGHTNTGRVVAALMRNEVRFGDAADTPTLAPSQDQAAAGGGTLLNYGDGTLRYKPTSLEHAGSGVGGGDWQARDLKWQSWTADEATATGTLIYNPCDPGCATAHARSTPATFRFFRPKRNCPIYRGSRTVREPRSVFTRVDVKAAAPAIERPWHTSPAEGFQCQ